MQVLAKLFTVIAVGDLLRAELEAAISLALPRVGRLSPRRPGLRVQGAGGRGRPTASGGRALLRLLMSLGSPATKRAASQALAQLTDAGIYPPEWVTEAGKAVPVQAWRRYDVFGDNEAIAVTFRYGEAEHGIFGQIDLTGTPSRSRSASPWTLPPDRGHAARTTRSTVRSRSAWPSAASAWSAAGPVGRETDPDLSVDTLAYLPIARSRVRRLPAEGAAAGQVFTAADRAAAVDEFLRSPLAAEAVAADEDATRFWAEVLTGYSSRIPGERPAQVGPRKIAHLLLGHVPNTFALSAAQRQHLEPAVTAWTRWSAERRGLDEAATARLTGWPAEVFGRFDAAYDDADAVTARGYLADLAVSDADVSTGRPRGAAHVRRAGPPLAPDGGGRWTWATRLCAGAHRASSPRARRTPAWTTEEFMAAVRPSSPNCGTTTRRRPSPRPGACSPAGADRHDIIAHVAEPKSPGAASSPAADERRPPPFYRVRPQRRKPRQA